MPSHSRKLSLVGIAAVLALLLSAYTMVPHRPSAQSAHAALPEGSGTVHFIQIATTSNTLGYETYINNPATNGQPNAILFVTPNFSPNYIFNKAPIGVWYDTSNKQWAIFNENLSSIAVGAAFNVLVVPTASGSVFVQTATPSNVSAYVTYINNPASNGHPWARLLVTSNWNPGSTHGIYDNAPIGVVYDTSNKQWAVFNENLSAMPIGAAFNVMIGSGSSGGGTEVLKTASASTTAFNATYINSGLANNNFNAVLFATLNWDPGGTFGPLDANAIGVWLGVSNNVDEWAVFNEDPSQDMPVGAVFNVLIFAS